MNILGCEQTRKGWKRRGGGSGRFRLKVKYDRKDRQ